METPVQSRRKMSRRNRLLFFFVAWVIVLMPFLFWHSTWFGAPLSDSELTKYLHDESKPRHIQHALVQIGERMYRYKMQRVQQWYPDLVRLSGHPVEEIRTTDAWVMGQDTTRPEFRESLLRLLKDPSENVRNNAALSLVRFGDASGHTQIAAMLQPSVVTAPHSGTISAVAKEGDPIRNGTMLVRLSDGEPARELRSPITGTVQQIKVKKGDRVQTGAEVAMVAPGTDQLWEALRALVVIGTRDDLEPVRRYERAEPNVADRVRQQAVETEKAILARAAKQ